jgi:UDP-glucose 4-epimerase
MRKVLVTGGFGFVGSHLVEELHRDPSLFIHVVDNLSSNPLPLPYLLAELGPMPRLAYDICSVQQYCDRNSDAHFDEIYHLASVVGPAGVIPHMGKIVKSIVDDTYAIMGLALRTGAKLIDVSTSEVYGGGREGYCSEEMPKIITSRTSARLEYAVGKLAAETALLNAAKSGKLNFCIIRPFNISGPRQSGKGGFVLPRFVSQAIRNRPLTIFGDGTQVRAFTHVKDIVAGIILTMQKGKSGEVYNIGNPNNKCTINQLADETIAIAQSCSKKLYVNPKTIYGPFYEEANDKYPDAKKAMTELKWEPRYDRRLIIQQTIEYFRGLDNKVFDILGGDREVHPSAERLSRLHQEHPHYNDE